MLGQIGRRGNEEPSQGAEPSCDVVADAHGTKTYGEVHAFNRRVNEAVVEHQLDRQAGMFLHQAEQNRRQQDFAKAIRGRDAQAPHEASRKRSNRGLRFGGFGQRAFGILVIDRAGICRPERPCRAVDQLRAQPALESRQSFAHRWLTQPQRSGRGRQRAQFDHTRIDPHRGEDIHCASYRLNR
jgi:hypothetical protein